MIIQFDPSLSGSDPSPDPHPASHHSSNWCHDQSNQVAFSKCASPEEIPSKIVNLTLVSAEEPTASQHYVEEIKAKRFKGANSIVLFSDESLLANTQKRQAQQAAGSWTSPTFLDNSDIIAAFESLPDAA